MSGDVVVQTLGLVCVAAVGAWGAVAAARRSGRTEKATEAVSAQLRPNGGSTMRDAVDRLDRRVTVHDEILDRIDAVVHRIERRQMGDESA